MKGGNTRHLLYGLLFAGALVLAPDFASAAKLFVTPSGGSYGVGATFAVTIRVNSEGTAINAAEGILTFNPEVLQVVSLSTAGTIFNVDVKGPDFSNSAGTIRWAGVILNPGYTGASGNLLTVNFRGRAQGTGRTLFDSAAVLANDGRGTNVLNGTSGGTYAIGPAISPTATPVASSEATPSTRPVITHYPESMESNTSFRIAGQAAPGETIRVQVFRSSTAWRRILFTDEIIASVDAQADASGRWEATIPGLPHGVYRVVANVIDGDGVVISASDPVTIRVGDGFWREFWYGLLSLSDWAMWLLLLFILGLLIVAARHFWLAGPLRGRKAQVDGKLQLILEDMDSELALLSRVAKHRPLYPEEQYLRSKLMEYRRNLKVLRSDAPSRLVKKK